MLEAIESLPADEQETFYLIRIQGLTLGEAAEVLGVSTKTVRRRVEPRADDRGRAAERPPAGYASDGGVVGDPGRAPRVGSSIGDRGGRSSGGHGHVRRPAEWSN